MIFTQSLVRSTTPNLGPIGWMTLSQNLIKAYRNYRDRCQTNQKLAILSDHLLSDIGKNRTDVSTISSRDQQLFQELESMQTQLVYLRLR